MFLKLNEILLPERATEGDDPKRSSTEKRSEKGEDRQF
jgi:hypothetical protein